MNRRCLMSAVAGLTLMLTGIFVPFMKDAVDAGLAGAARTALASNDVTGVRVNADWASLTLEGHASSRHPALAAVRGMAHGGAVRTVTYVSVGGGRAWGTTTKTPAHAAAPVGTARVRAALAQDGVTFGTDRASLTPRAKAVLGRAAALLEQHPGVYVAITGYTDDQGSAPGNRVLSLARANAARDYLAAHGVAAGRVTTGGDGAGPDRRTGGSAGRDSGAQGHDRRTRSGRRPLRGTGIGR